MGIWTSMLTFLFISVSSSPLSMSFLLVITSIWVAMHVMMSSMSLFSSCAIMISFSTGMMILFCYCSSLVSFEKKNNNKKELIIMTLMIMMLTISTTENSMNTTSMSSISMEFMTQFLSVAIMLVILSMLGINKCMFNPNKSSMSVY